MMMMIHIEIIQKIRIGIGENEVVKMSRGKERVNEKMIRRKELTWEGDGIFCLIM